MPVKFSSQELEDYRSKCSKSDDSHLNALMGNYLIWFAVCEVALTSYLAFALRIGDFERLDYVVRGMDARVKCDRLRKAAARYHKLGDSFRKSLEIFERSVIPLRNLLAHSWPSIHDNRLYFTSFAMSAPGGQIASGRVEADYISLDDFTLHSMWVEQMAKHLVRGMNTTPREVFEIDDLNWSLPTLGQAIQKKSRPSRAGKPSPNPRGE